MSRAPQRRRHFLVIAAVGLMTGTSGVRLGGFTATPNPAQEGQPLSVSGEPGATIFWIPEGTADWITLKLDSNGNGTIQPPTGVPGVTISDLKLPNANTVFVEIESSQ